MAGELVRFSDCKDLGTLTRLLDEQQLRTRARDFQDALKNIGKGLYFDDANRIQALFSQPFRTLTPLSVGTLVYCDRQRNIARSDATAGNPAMFVVVAQIDAQNVLASPFALLFVNVTGTQTTGIPTAQGLYLGDTGFSAFAPPDAAGAINQKVGVAFYEDTTINRWYALIQPTAVFVGL